MIKRFFSTTTLKANIISNFIGNAWSSIISLLFVPFYLKYIGAEGYGLIGIFASLQVVLSLLDSGFSTTLNKELARLSVLKGQEQKMRNIVKTLGGVYWVISLIAGLIAILLSPLLAKYWVQPKELSVEIITYSFVLLSMSIIFQLPSGFYSGGLMGLHRQVTLNFIRVFFATIKSVGALLVLIYFSQSILFFFSWILIVAIFQAFTFRFFLWYYLPNRNLKAVFDKQELKNIQKFAVGIIGISLTAILLTQIDKIILSKILTLEQFGYYSISCTMGMVIFQIVGPITQSYFPKLSNLVSLNNISELKIIYHQACQLISLFVIPSTLVLIFFSKELIYIWTKNDITVEQTWLITAIYAYGTGINGLMNIPYLLTLSYGWTNLGFYQNIVFIILMIPLTIFLSLNHGALGGALSWATINTLYFFITPVLIHNKLLKGEVINWYWSDTIKPLLISLFVIISAKYFIFYSEFGLINELLNIVLIGFLSLLCMIPFMDKLKQIVFNYIKKN